ncbi:MAG: PadR family transcriptional regulator [Thermoanaerobaculia bacterium]
MAGEKRGLLQGTLDLLVLKCLAGGAMHGLGISRRIHLMTGGAFEVKPGSLFPALYRLEQERWVVSAWGKSESNRKAKYYELTKAGLGQLAAETRQWNRIAAAMGLALGAV